MTNLSAAKLRRREIREARSRSISPQPIPPVDNFDLASVANEEAPYSIHNNLESSRAQNVTSAVQVIKTSQPRNPRTLQSSHLRSPDFMSSLRPVRLLIASLGNPVPYINTRHSAGHTLLKSLASTLQLPPLSKSKLYGGANASLGSDIGQPEYTLYQSPSLMNVSGTNVLKAWKYFSSLHPSSPTQQSDPDTRIIGLVILHDELELPTGQLKLRRGAGSARGHNGLKSIQTSFSSGGLLDSLGQRFIKIGVGIGRPTSREKGDVSDYVLAQLSDPEKRKIEASAGTLAEMLRGEIERLGRTR